MAIKNGAPAFVYFLRPVGMAGPIKIGCTQHIDQRFRTMTYWSPFPLEMVLAVPGTTALEAELHARFADLRLHHEWFRADPRLDALIAELSPQAVAA